MSSDLYRFGQSLRELLLGFSEEGETEGPKRRIAWAQFVDPSGLPELYAGDGAPKKHQRGVVPPAGIDNMNLKTTDVFLVPGRGEFAVDFRGYLQVTRATPANRDWQNQRMVFNYTQFKLFGSDSGLGAITVDLNPDYISGGETFRTRKERAGCKANTAARFHMHDLNMTLFNKTPIILKNENMQGIPTIGEGSKIDAFHTALYSVDDPEGEPKAYLEELEYTVLNYMMKEEALAYRASTSETHFNQLIAASS